MFSTVYRVTQKYIYARPYMRMHDLRHNSDNDDLELITPHMLINTWQELEYLSSYNSCQGEGGGGEGEGEEGEGNTAANILSIL